MSKFTFGLLINEKRRKAETSEIIRVTDNQMCLQVEEKFPWVNDLKSFVLV